MTAVKAVVVGFATTQVEAKLPGVNPNHFMNGIALLICMDQFKHLGGFLGSKPFGGDLMANVAVAAGSFLAAFFPSRFLGRSLPGIAKLIPGTLAATLLGTGAVHLLGLNVELVQVDAKTRC